MNNSIRGNFLENSPNKAQGLNLTANRFSGTGQGSNYGSGQPQIDGNYLSEPG